MPRHTPNGWFIYDPLVNRWNPTELNSFSDWKNEVITDCFRPDERGFSRWVAIDDLKARFPEQANQFGGNGSNFFSRNSPVLDFAMERRPSGGKVEARRLAGLTHTVVNQTSRVIRPDILRTVRSMPCALTGQTTDIECDHKCSRRPPNTDPKLQSIDDFQPLSKAANCRKRSVCGDCVRNNQRFDARTLGFAIGWLSGNATTPSCEGCFWHDIHRFRAGLTLASVDT